MGMKLGKFEGKTALNSLCIFTEFGGFLELDLEEGEADLE